MIGCRDGELSQNAAALNMRVEDMVLSDQTHTTNVRVITEEDRAKAF